MLLWKLLVRKRPDDAFLHYLIAEILAQQGATPGDLQFQAAIKEGERAVQLRPDFVLAHDTLAGLYLKSRQISQSIAHSRQALRLLPSDQNALYHLIQALRESGQQQELPQLVNRLAELRREAKDTEAKLNRYKIFESGQKD
jgi:tetratricopeptide (TPR) repeat protein